MLYSVPQPFNSGPIPLLDEKHRGKVEGGLTVSQDLKILAFTHTIGMIDGFGGARSATDVFLLEEGETEPVRAENFNTAKLNPSLSPDGKWMAYEVESVDPNAPYKIWVGTTPFGR
jgi:hypothetical protein